MLTQLDVNSCINLNKLIVVVLHVVFLIIKTPISHSILL